MRTHTHTVEYHRLCFWINYEAPNKESRLIVILPEKRKQCNKWPQAHEDLAGSRAWRRSELEKYNLFRENPSCCVTIHTMQGCGHVWKRQTKKSDISLYTFIFTSGILQYWNVPLVNFSVVLLSLHSFIFLPWEMQLALCHLLASVTIWRSLTVQSHPSCCPTYSELFT